MESPEVSVIIPCRAIDRYTEECVERCLNNPDYKNVEIIVLPDKKDNLGIKDNRVKIIPTGEKTPGAKRNIGIENSTGKAVGVKQARNELIALINSNNILPSKDWFSRMTEPFQDREIAGTEPLYYTYRKRMGISRDTASCWDERPAVLIPWKL